MLELCGQVRHAGSLAGARVLWPQIDALNASPTTQGRQSSRNTAPHTISRISSWTVLFDDAGNLEEAILRFDGDADGLGLGESGLNHVLAHDVGQGYGAGHLW